MKPNRPNTVPLNTRLRLLLIFACLVSTAQAQAIENNRYATHQEEFNVYILKTTADQTNFNHLIEHTYRITAGLRSTPPSDQYVAPGIAGLFFDKVSKHTQLQAFNLSFSLGNLPYEELFNLPTKLPRFGSFLVVRHYGGDKELGELSYLIGGFFGLSHGRIAGFEKLTNHELGLSWYSYAPEHFCLDQLYRILKFYPGQNGLHKLLTGSENILFKYPYASVKIEFTAETDKPASLSITLRAAVPDSQKKKFSRLKFSPLAPLDPRALGLPKVVWPKITQIDFYKEKVLNIDIPGLLTELAKGDDAPSTEDNRSFTLEELLNLSKKLKVPKTQLVSKVPGFKVDRFVRGRISSFNNTLIHIISGSNFEQLKEASTRPTDSQKHVVTVMVVSDSHQHFFLSDIKIVKLSDLLQGTQGSAQQINAGLPHKARYIKRLPKPNSNLPITVVEVKFELAQDEAAQLSMPYLINLRKVSEYEHEYERGTYIIGSVAVFSSQPNLKEQIVELHPLLTNEKMIDSTFAFTTLTLNNVIFFILPITIMFLGINA